MNTDGHGWEDRGLLSVFIRVHPWLQFGCGGAALSSSVVQFGGGGTPEDGEELSLDRLPGVFQFERGEVHLLEVVLAGSHLLHFAFGGLLERSKIKRRGVTNELTEERAIIGNVVGHHWRA